MGFDKTVTSTIFTVTAQNSDTRLPVGSSAANAHTAILNPLRGTLMWDYAMYTLRGVAVSGGATGGSYTVTVQTDAVAGYTGLPIASVTLGPNSSATAVLDNLHQSPSSPLPTHLFIDQTATGGTLGLTCEVTAKQYRGFLGTPGAATSERILQGNMITGLSNTVDFSGDEGVSVDVTFVLGTSGTALGMHRMRHWDHVLYWAVAGEYGG